MEEKLSHPDKNNPIRAPFIPLAISRRLIHALAWCVVGLTLVTILLAIGFATSINRKPWVLVATEGGYEEMGIGKPKTSRKDVERFLSMVIPNIYGSINAEGPGLTEIRGMVNENIISSQQQSLTDRENELRNEGISQFAIVSGINPETMVIDRQKNIAYAEAIGTIVLTKENRSKKTDVQWRCLMYLVEPTSKLSSSTLSGKMAGNKMGLFLQQISEQPPGTINDDSPKPTAADVKERSEEENNNQTR